MNIPKVYELCNPTLQAMRTLGGSGSAQEIGKSVIHQMQLPEEIVRQTHRIGSQTELEYRLVWALTVLKAYGLVIDAERGAWSLTKNSSLKNSVDPEEVRRFYVGHGGTLDDASVEALTVDVAECLEDDLWRRFGAEQFLAGYSEADSVYDEG